MDSQQAMDEQPSERRPRGRPRKSTPPEPAEKRPVGRPKGSKNKPKQPSGPPAPAPSSIAPPRQNNTDDDREAVQLTPGANDQSRRRVRRREGSSSEDEDGGVTKRGRHASPQADLPDLQQGGGDDPFADGEVPLSGVREPSVQSDAGYVPPDEDPTKPPSPDSFMAGGYESAPSPMRVQPWTPVAYRPLHQPPPTTPWNGDRYESRFQRLEQRLDGHERLFSQQAGALRDLTLQVSRLVESITSGQQPAGPARLRGSMQRAVAVQTESLSDLGHDDEGEETRVLGFMDAGAGCDEDEVKDDEDDEDEDEEPTIRMIANVPARDFRTPAEIARQRRVIEAIEAARPGATASVRRQLNTGRPMLFALQGIWDMACDAGKVPIVTASYVFWKEDEVMWNFEWSRQLVTTLFAEPEPSLYGDGLDVYTSYSRQYLDFWANKTSGDQETRAAALQARFGEELPRVLEAVGGSCATALSGMHRLQTEAVALRAIDDLEEAVGAAQQSTSRADVLDHFLVDSGDYFLSSDARRRIAERPAMRLFLTAVAEAATARHKQICERRDVLKALVDGNGHAWLDCIPRAARWVLAGRQLDKIHDGSSEAAHSAFAALMQQLRPAKEELQACSLDVE
ncbi:uncharacterized protein B0I36DRAFT_408362 [Microdochium trichocladiopsis]|uniref:Uncharacterized protein n=1 Tax=Microdochium trichocladiopsis TaxID=1682393 RepID=A0A9P8Y9Q9_9PEZI|nr:uncharacterized protein B0I36DRAFT_408362 [Microdochium trichocladiopsis]KAH7033677.1 hypothetical protein B0I36DRAFT_408362 [Microdochium trichocladiopsis]